MVFEGLRKCLRLPVEMRNISHVAFVGVRGVRAGTRCRMNLLSG